MSNEEEKYENCYEFDELVWVNHQFIKFVKKDVNFLTKQVDILSRIVNTLLIIFYFQEYIKFDENTEKSLIRSAISNDLGYKKKVVEVLEEI